MNKKNFTIICGCLMFFVTMTIRAQEGHIDDSVSIKIALNDKDNPEIRKFVLSKMTDQSIFGQIALNNKDNPEIRKFVLSKITDQSVFEQIALNNKDNPEIRKFALTQIK